MDAVGLVLELKAGLGKPAAEGIPLWRSVIRKAASVPLPASVGLQMGPCKCVADEGNVSHQGKLMAIVCYVKIIECFAASQQGFKVQTKLCIKPWQTDLSRCIIMCYKMILKLFSGVNLFVDKTIEKSKLTQKIKHLDLLLSHLFCISQGPDSHTARLW